MKCVPDEWIAFCDIEFHCARPQSVMWARVCVVINIQSELLEMQEPGRHK